METGPSTARVEFAHLLRGIAAASVLASHLAYSFWLKPEIVGDLIARPTEELVNAAGHSVAIADFGLLDFWGFFGVGLFFLISGFVIPFSTARLSRTGFALARVFRIWPTYMAGLTVTLVCITLNASASGAAFPYEIREVLYHYLILPRWPTLTRPIDGILWTLEIEIFFYAFCIIFIGRLRRADTTIFFVGILAVPAALALGLWVNELIALGYRVYALAHWASSMLLFVSFLLIGTAFHYHHTERLSTAGLIVANAGLLASFWAGWMLGPFGEQGASGPISFTITNLVFAAAYAGRTMTARRSGVAKRLLWRLADISYPLYAVHAILGYTILALLLQAGTGPWLALGCAVAVAVGAATALHVLVEIPSRAFGKTLAARYGEVSGARAQQ